MQHLRTGNWDEEGCFVFQVFGAKVRVEVRHDLSVSDNARTGLSFMESDLVAVDCIKHSAIQLSDNGPFLRLADCAGWLFVHKHGRQRMRQVPVQSGLFSFYVDNFPAGIHLRRHPTDRADLKSCVVTDKPHPVAYLPQQKIYCDRRVTHPDTGIHYYRVQGTTGWVFDRRTQAVILLEAAAVKTGLFGYRALKGVSIRSKCQLGDDFKTHRIVQEGELVAVDVVQESPYPNGNGPFLRLTDGSGWLFARKRNQITMEEIKVEFGSWSFKVLQSVALRRHPVRNSHTQYPNKVYGTGERLLCDARIAGPGQGTGAAVYFYRVMKTDGWVFDVSEQGRAVLELYWTGPSQNELDAVSFSEGVAWSPDFVRGVACTIPKLLEILFDQANKLICFRTEEGVRINIYYSTRTVGTALNHPVHGTTQLYRPDCTVEQLSDILRNPRAHSGQAYHKRKWDTNPAILQSSLGPGIVVKEEEVIRVALQECDREMLKLQEKRLELLMQAKKFDDDRATEAQQALQKYMNMLPTDKSWT